MSIAKKKKKKDSQKSFQCKTGSQIFFLLLINEHYENNKKELKIFLSKMLIKLESSSTYAHQLLYENLILNPLRPEVSCTCNLGSAECACN